MSYIYKITNSENNKVYIGYTSQSLATRFSKHKSEARLSSYEENKSLLYSAMRKYGEDKFSIEAVYEFDEDKEDWRELEKYYIKKFDALNGYNLLEGGEIPPIHYGNDNKKTKIKDEQLSELFTMLKDTKNSYKDIAAHFDVSVSELYRINRGEMRRQVDISYPIRKYTQYEEYALEIMDLLYNDITLSNAKIAARYPCYRPNEIASINTGKKYGYLWQGSFPIRTIIVPDDYDEKQAIAQEVLQYIKDTRPTRALTQKELQEHFHQSRYTIEKIIKGIYPYKIENMEFPIKLTKLNN